VIASGTNGTAEGAAPRRVGVADRLPQLLGRLSVALLVATAASGGTTEAYAQTDPDEPTVESQPPMDRASPGDDPDRTGDYFGDSHRRELYEEGKLQYSRAALWSALFPGLGNFYARQYFIGGLNASLMGFTAILIPYGFSTDQLAFVWTGVGLAGSAYVSGFTSSFLGVRNYNRRLRRSLRVSSAGPDRIPPASGSTAVPGISIGFRF